MPPTTHNWVPHPGEFIREEMEARGWLQRDLAFILQCPEQAVNLILSNKRGISPEMAKALGIAFDVPAEFFANLQYAYDLSRAQDPSPAVAIRAQLQNVYPVREMIKRGWIEDGPVDLLQLQLCRFFEVKEISGVPYLAHAAKKTTYERNHIPPAQLAWLFRVRQLARSFPAPPYSRAALLRTIKQLERILPDPAQYGDVPELLAACGVRLVIVESLPGAKIDGACLWLNKKSPVVGLSLRFDRIDNFWFVLRHELEHVLNGDGHRNEIIDSDLDPPRDGTAIENAANAAAAEFCAPTAAVDSFIAAKSPYLAEKDILALSAALHRHPGLVVGQIQRRTGRHELLKRHQVKVRPAILSTAIADGWGKPAHLSV